MHPGASRLIRRLMAQTVTRACSSPTQTVTIAAIAIGCGGLGGGGDTTSMCGDASPIGGHFGGFFSENTVFTPDINDAGDVLFFAMSMAANHDEDCSFIRLRPGKL